MNVVWRKEWTKEDETPWSIFEKMSYANRVERNDMLRILGSYEVKAIKGNIIGDNRRELIDLNGFDNDLLSSMLSLNLREHNKSIINSIVSPLHYYERPERFWFSKYVRWCTECLNSGFHSWLHQFILVIDCPYHGITLIETCPECNQQIPFLLSNKGLSSSFTCKCGHRLSDTFSSRWKKWTTLLSINSSSASKWIADCKQKAEEGERWFFLPQHCEIDLLTIMKPIFESKEFCRQQNNDDYFRSNDFRLKYFYENKAVFIAIEHHILKKHLRGHYNCIEQLLELQKEEGHDFPEICPYAYAYVFWKKSILNLDHFYRKNRDEISPPSNYGLDTATKLIHSELRDILDEYIRQTSMIKTNESSVHWIVNRITANFSIRFFFEWLKIADDGARNEYAPSWTKIENMKRVCFPRFAFSYDISSDRELIRYYEMPYSMTEKCNLHKYECPARKIINRRKLKRMQSYTPERIAMMVFENPNEENKKLQKYVDRYVRKFRF